MKSFKTRLLKLLPTFGLMMVLSFQAEHALADTAWRDLSPKQQELLTPVRSEWLGMSSNQKERWMKVGQKYEQESPENQAKMRERIFGWSKLTPTQKAQARENYQALKDKKRGERNSSWNSYQTLEPEEKGKFKDKHEIKREQSQTNPFVTPGAAAYTR
jgi:hypothetical protein